MTAKEIDRLEMAICRAEQHASRFADTEDNGTCNFDTPMIKVKATERQLAAMDWKVMKYGKRQPDGTSYFLIFIDLRGQGNRRTRMAEAAVESLRESGYNASVCYQMD